MSTWIDTNGQNARYAKAADRWGAHPDVVTKVMALGKVDPAGVVGRFAKYANKGQTLHIRSAHKSEAYFAFPGDIRWDKHTEPEVRRLAAEADVLHLNNSDRAYRLLHLRKPALLHHHGSLFRADPQRWFGIARYHRMIQAVSTIDLQREDPKTLHWLPTAYDLEELAAIRAEHRRPEDGVIRIVSAPTNREYKATVALGEAVRRLQKEGLAIELVIVEGRPWRECLIEKAKADILFDQVAFGYGCNAVEAWGMGIPVIAGADGWTEDRMTAEWGGLPYYRAAYDGIAEAIRPLVESADLRAEWAERGAVHAAKYHAEKPALARLAELYTKAIRYFEKSRDKVAPVTFISKRQSSVSAAGVSVSFVHGPVTTNDPYLIERLRYFAVRRPSFGISEEVKA